MRTEQEMMTLILNIARQDERIRAVAMNGSRTNKNVPKDIFQDFDIVYLVENIDSFIQDFHWVDVFGERIMMQTPKHMTLFPSEGNERFPYLMLFIDGNRIDLTLLPFTERETYLTEDKLTVILMDKDRALPTIMPPSDEDYWVKCPDEKLFADCCNEFWWVSTYVAKGLWRREMLYAQEHLNRYVRPMLLNMLDWQVGIKTNFSVSTGKSSKYLERFLPEKTWQHLLSTYANGDYDDVWRALFTTMDVFRTTAKYVAQSLHYEYPDEMDTRVTAYVKHVRRMPPDAAAIY